MSTILRGRALGDLALPGPIGPPRDKARLKNNFLHPACGLHVVAELCTTLSLPGVRSAPIDRRCSSHLTLRPVESECLNIQTEIWVEGLVNCPGFSGG